jgi:hypothetical protein
MAHLLTVLCDRCVARAPERRVHRGVVELAPDDLPEGWTRLNGLDLCAPCWASYCEWEGAHIRARKETR